MNASQALLTLCQADFVLQYFDQAKKDCDNNTLVNTFSLSKGIYCGCLLKLIDQNEINLDKEISFYWKNFG